MGDTPLHDDETLDSPAALGAHSGPTADVAIALQSLSRAARSFSLYDAQNDAVKRLIADYRLKTEALVRRAPFSLDVYPFSIQLDGQPVYAEDDRERSLSFRLFRDGVRRLRFEQGVDWAQMVTLLEVLSVRCTGIREQEDDLITLLRKASFKQIAVEAVEGYLPDEEQPEAARDAPKLEHGPKHEPPRDWDLPLPHLEPGEVRYRELSSATLRELVAEDSPSALPAMAVRAARELFEVARGLGDKQLEGELSQFLQEIQEFLRLEKNVAELTALAMLCGAPLPMLDDARAFERLLSVMPARPSAVPEPFYELLEEAQGDHLDALLARLAADKAGEKRATLVAVLEREAKANPDALLRRLPTAPPGLARELFGILERVAPTRVTDAAFELLEHPDPELSLDIVEIIAKAPPGVRLARGLQRLMASADERVRIRAAEKLAERGGPRAVAPLEDHLKTQAALLTKTEASAVGRALVLASQSDALELFARWIQSATGLRGIMSRFSKEHQAQPLMLWAAVAGLEVCKGPTADALLSALSSHAQGELASHCREAMARRAGGGRRA